MSDQFINPSMVNNNPSDIKPTIAVIIPNWNLRIELVDCLNSLLRSTYKGLVTIVVDNGSTDDSVEVVKDNFPDVQIIKSNKNLGFAGGVNLGIRKGLKLGAKYFLVLNNDTVVPPETIGELFSVMELHPELGIIAPKVLYYDNPSITFSLGDKVYPYMPLPIPVGKMKIDKDNNEQIMVFDYLFGCALLIRKDVIEKIGLFDTSYFMFYEDADYCRRAREAGYLLARIANARILHKGSVSVKKEKPMMTFYRARNRLRFFRRYRHGIHPIITFMALSIGSLWRVIRMALSGNLSSIKPYVRGVISGLFENLPAPQGIEIE